MSDSAQHIIPVEQGEVVPDSSSRSFITIFLSYKPGNELKNFRCFNCGRLVFVYGEGQIFQIFEAKAIADTYFVDYICNNRSCKMIYRVYGKS